MKNIALDLERAKTLEKISQKPVFSSVSTPSLHILRILYISLALLSFCSFRLSAETIDTDHREKYGVNFENIDDPEIITLLSSTSQLLALEKLPPATVAGLRRRIETDTINFTKVMHSLAYYNAKVTISLDLEKTPIQVTIHIDSGPVYPLAKLEIKPINQTKNATPSNIPYENLDLRKIGITLNKPAFPKKINDAKDKLLILMKEQGYPLAQIPKLEIVADQRIKAIYATLYIDSGPLTYFENTTITGLKRVDASVIQKKITWKKGNRFDPQEIEHTHMALEASRLFKSIHISHAEKATSEQQLPMQIEVIEGRHRSIGGGLAYATQFGPGLAFEWESRNVRGLGEKLSLTTNLWLRTQEGTLRYTKPNFLQQSQDLLWVAELDHEETDGFTDSSFSLSCILEKQINEETRISYGGAYKRLFDSHSENNGAFNLFKTPFHLQWTQVDNILDPTKGRTLNLKMIPSLQMVDHQFAYCINTLTGTYYIPLTRNHRYVFATKLGFGSIFGSNKHTIPASEMFYEGSENSLRGYHYQTVSPLNHKHKPTGGRSLFISSIELRAHASNKIGWVVFYDVGNVYEKSLPSLDHKFLQSIGIGLRYHTPVGPLRFDIAFPLNPRPHLDHRFQIYLSIGQVF